MRMINKIKTKGTAAVLTCALLFSLCAGQAHTKRTSAAATDISKITYPASRTVWNCNEGIGDDEDLYLYGKNVPKGAVIVNLTSSNKKIVKVKISEDDSQTLHIDKKKAGTAIISFDLIWGTQKDYWEENEELNGTEESKHFSCKVKILKYTNPCKSFMIAGKDYSKKFKKNPSFWNENMPKKCKITVKAKSGWKFVKLTRRSGGKEKKIKNGSVVSIKGTTFVHAYFKNNKSKLIREVTAELYSPQN